MSKNLPEPPIGQDVELGDLKYMPLEILAVQRSRFIANADPFVFKAAFLLWVFAWWEKPAGSIPDDEEAIADACRISVDELRAHKSEILNGFELCSDGRLYHKTVTKWALHAWDQKGKNRTASESAKIRMRRYRARTKPEANISEVSDFPEDSLRERDRNNVHVSKDVTPSRNSPNRGSASHCNSTISVTHKIIEDNIRESPPSPPLQQTAASKGASEDEFTIDLPDGIDAEEPASPPTGELMVFPIQKKPRKDARVLDIDELTLTPDLIEFCRKEGPDVDWQWCLNEFKDWVRAKSPKMTDYKAGFRNSVRRAQVRHKQALQRETASRTTHPIKLTPEQRAYAESYARWKEGGMKGPKPIPPSEIDHRKQG